MNWKRVIAKEWLIILAIVILSPAVGYGVYLYQDHVYKKEKASFDSVDHRPFDETDYLARIMRGRKISEMSLKELDEYEKQLQKHSAPTPPSLGEYIYVHIFSIPFIYLFLVIVRLTLWSLKTVRRRSVQIQVSPSNS